MNKQTEIIKNTNQVNYWKQTLNQQVKNIFKNQQPALKSIKASCYQNKEVIASQKEIHERNITPYE